VNPSGSLAADRRRTDQVLKVAYRGVGR